MRIEEAWLAHLGASEPVFPRELAFPVAQDRFTRKLVHSPTEYVELLNKLAPSRNVYTALYTPYQHRERVFDKLYLDVDAPTLEEAYGHAKRLVEAIQARYGRSPRTYLSGCKGFAIYLDFPAKQLVPLAMKVWAQRLADEAHAQIDMHVLGDVRRVSRVPYTYNFNALSRLGTVGFCIPVDPEAPLQDILSESRHPSALRPVELVPFPEAADEISSIRVDTVEVTNVPPVDPGRCSDDLRRLLELAPRVQDGRHRLLHFVVIPLLVGVGATPEQTVDYCQRWLEATGKSYHDYDRYVRESYERNSRQGWRPWSLDTLLARNPDILGALA